MKKIVKMIALYLVIFLVVPQITKIIFNYNNGDFNIAYIGGALTPIVLIFMNKLITKEVI